VRSATLVARLRPLPRRLALPRPGPVLGRRLLVLAAATGVLAAAYFLWLRDSSLVQIERVTVTGLTTRDAGPLRRALTSEAGTMTTLHVRPERLRGVLAGSPAVASLRVETDFPHGLRIRVVEHRPVAVALAGGARVPVAADGRLLPGLPTGGRLPAVRVPGPLPAGRLAGRPLLAGLRVAAAAPRALLARVRSLGPVPGRGLVAHLRSGPDLVFGSPTRLRAKWIVAGRVLADPSASGTTYVDLRLPERPAAGGFSASTATAPQGP
jgi:cell division protein FtsQ